MTEEWRPVVGWEGLYEVSDRGRVKNVLRNRVLVAAQSRGYLFVTLSGGGRKISSRIHRLVAQAFIPNPENKPWVPHGPGGKTENSKENLRWGTPSDNIRDEVRDNTHRNSRKTHCKRGHEFIPENTGIRTGRSGLQRKCLRCHADWQNFYTGYGPHPDDLIGVTR